MQQTPPISHPTTPPHNTTMVRLSCALIGKSDGAFELEIDAKHSMNALDRQLKKVIREQAAKDREVDSEHGRIGHTKSSPSSATVVTANDRLDLVLVKKLSPDTIHQLQKGIVPEEICTLMVAPQERSERKFGELSVDQWLDQCNSTGLSKYWRLTSTPTPQYFVLVALVAQVEPWTISQPPDSMKFVLAEDTGSTRRWLQHFQWLHIAAHCLPSVEELGEFLGSALPVKIGVHPLMLDKWHASVVPADPQLLASLFQPARTGPCVDLINLLVYHVLYPVTITSTQHQARECFISLWDACIRNVLNVVLAGLGTSCREASTSRSGADFTCAVDAVCVLRGKETSPCNSSHLKTLTRDFFGSMRWNHGQVPYLFGYTASGYLVRLYALLANEEAQAGDPTIQENEVNSLELASFDLEQLGDRLRLLLAMLNLARLVCSLAKLSCDQARDEYATQMSANGVWERLEPTRVVKTFPPEVFESARDQLQQVYRFLKEHKVLNVDRLVAVDESLKQMVFVPRGSNTVPRNLSELFDALRDVLTSLVELHAGGWMHRDIQWNHVKKRRDGSKSWFLVDFTEAAPSPQRSPSGRHLQEDLHAPEIFTGGFHTTAVDLWSVGRLIENCREDVCEQWYDLGGERTDFLETLTHNDPAQRPSASAALATLEQLRQQWMDQEQQEQPREPNKKRRRL